MAVIRKKSWPENYETLASGKKKFDLRLNDAEVKEGDTLVLEEWDPKTQRYTGRTLEKKITYVAPFKIDESFWPEEEIKLKGFQILSLE
jgi:hypothetical protein